MTTVVVEPDASWKSALKRLKKSCDRAGLLFEFEKRQHDEKPSARRIREILAGRRERVSD